MMRLNSMVFGVYILAILPFFGVFNPLWPTVKYFTYTDLSPSWLFFLFIIMFATSRPVTGAE